MANSMQKRKRIFDNNKCNGILNCLFRRLLWWPWLILQSLVPWIWTPCVRFVRRISIQMIKVRSVWEGVHSSHFLIKLCVEGAYYLFINLHIQYRCFIQWIIHYINYTANEFNIPVKIIGRLLSFGWHLIKFLVTSTSSKIVRALIPQRAQWVLRVNDTCTTVVLILSSSAYNCLLVCEESTT